MIEIIREKMVNEYGTGYGNRIVVFASSQDEADEYIRENLDNLDGRPFWEGRDSWHQLSVETIVVSYTDPYVIALRLYAKKKLGPSVLKRIARMAV